MGFGFTFGVNSRSSKGKEVAGEGSDNDRFSGAQPYMLMPFR